jgi:hypothetical protein
MADADEFELQLGRAKALAVANRVPEAKALLDALKAEYPGRREPFEVKAIVFIRTGWYRKALAEWHAMPLAGAPEAEKESIIFRAFRLQQYIAAVRSRPRFLRPAPQPPVEQAVMIMMVRDEADIIRANLDHHYTLGFRNFVILLNCCHDATPQLVADFQTDRPDAVVCAINDPVEAYYQSDKTQAAVEFARTYFPAIRRPISWCFIADADEFIVVEGEAGVHGLIAAAKSANKDFICFQLCNATSSRDPECRPGTDIYTHFDVVCGSHGDINPKHAFRLDLNVRVRMGNHAVFYEGVGMDRGLVGNEFGGRMIHLPYRSAAQLQSKILNGGSAYAATDLEETLGRHWREMYREYLRDGPGIFEREIAAYRERTLRFTREPMGFIY